MTSALPTVMAALAVGALPGPTTSTHAPAPWQQRVAYRIEAVLDEDAGRLEGRARLRYHNASPDTLRRLFFQENLNAFRPGSAWAAAGEERRFGDFGALEEPDYAFQRLSSVRIDDRVLTPSYPEAPDSTVVRIELPEPLPPGGDLTVDLAWTARPATLCRRQCRRGRHWDFAHWYPRIAVYDEGGWQVRALRPSGEFYGEFGAYDVTLDLAEDQVVGASGVPVQGDPGWHPSPWSAVQEIDFRSDVYGPAGPAEPLGLLSAAAGPHRRRVRFLAEDVHHFAFSVDPEFMYEGGRAGDVAVHVLYLPGDLDWSAGAVVNRTVRAVEWLKDTFGGYPYPQLTNLHRLEDGATEFPMVIMDGDPEQGTILHETAHQFAHAALGNNEWREAWLDEGMASFLSGWFAEEVGDQPYPFARPVLEMSRERAAWRFPMDTVTHDFPDFDTYQTVAYTKGRVVLLMLRELVGEDTMRGILRAYYRENLYRHVTDRDLQAAAEEVSGRELGWFFDQWARRPAELDYALGRVSVAATTDGRFRTTVEVHRRGGAWMPVTLQVGPVRRVLDSRDRTQEVTVTTDERPDLVVLDPDLVLLETDKGNNGRRLE